MFKNDLFLKNLSDPLTRLDLISSFGHSSSLEENFSSYAEVLKSKFDFGFIAYFAKYENQIIKFGFPKSKTNALSSELIRLIGVKSKANFKTIKKGTKAFHKLSKVVNSQNQNFAVFNCGKRGYMVISSSEIIRPDAGRLLSKIMGRFGILMEGLSLKVKFDSTQQRFKDFINRLNLGVASIEDNKLVVANQFFVKTFCSGKDQLVGKDISSIFDKDSHRQIKKISKSFREENKDFGELYTEHKTRDGKIKKFHFRVFPKFDNNNQMGEWIVVDDITIYRNAENELHARTALLNAIIESSPDDIFAVDTLGKVMLYNEKVEEAFKRVFKKQFKIGENIFEGVKGGEDYDSYMKKAINGESTEITFESKEGKNIRTSLISFSPIKDKNNSVIGGLSMSKDITNFVEQEALIKERESTLSAIIESSPENILVVDKNLEIILINQGSAKGFKKNFNIYPKVGDPIFDLIDKKEGAKYKRLMRRSLKGEKVSFDFTSAPDERGEIFHVIIEFAPVYDSDGKIFGAISITKDVTDLVKKEHKLVENEAWINAVFNASQHGMLGFDLDYNINTINKLGKKIGRNVLGAHVDVGVNLKDIFSAEDFKQRTKIYEPIIKNKKSLVFSEKRMFKGKSIYLTIAIDPVLDKNENVIGIVQSIKDVTEEKKTERQIIEREALLSSVLNSSDDGIIAFDLDYKLTHINKKARVKTNRDFKKTPAKDHHLIKTYGKKVFEKREQEFYSQIIKDQKSIIREEVISVDGKNEYNEIHVLPILDKDDKLIGIMESVRNITELREQQQHVMASEATLKAVIDASPDGIYALDRDFNVVVINNQAIEDFKVQANLDVYPGVNFKDIVDKSILDRWNKSYFSKIFSGKKAVYEGELINGAYVENRYHAVRNADDEIFACLEISRDLTELKNRELALIESEEKYKALVQTSPSGISLVNLKGENLFLSERATEIFGFVPEERINRSIMDVIHPEFVDKVKETFAELIDKQNSVKLVVKCLHKSGREIWIDVFGKPMYDNNGHHYAILFMYNDITERVKVENALAESEVKYKNLVETSPTGISQVCFHGIIKFISERGAEIFGYKSKEMMGKKLDEFLGEHNLNTLHNKIKGLKKSEDFITFRMSVPTKKGNYIYVDGTGKIMRDDKGDVFDVFYNFNDVTVRVMAEKALKQSEETFSTMYENMFDAILIYDFLEDKIKDCNQAALDLFKYSKKTLLKKKRLDLISTNSENVDPVRAKELIELARHRILKNETAKSSIVVADKFGQEYMGEVNVIPTGIKEGEVFIVLHDQTIEIIAQQNLKAKNKEIEHKNLMYEAVISDSFDGIDVIEYDLIGDKMDGGSLLIRNDHMSAVFNHEPGLFASIEEILRYSPEFQSDGQASKDVLREVFLNLFRTKTEIRNYDFVYPDGREIIMETVNRLIDLSDKKALLVRNYKDVTEVFKQKEIIQEQIEDLNLKNEELKKYIDSNLQLENFAYIASHDLKAPLRTVTSFAQLLKNRCYENVDEKCQKYLDIVLTSSTNMQLLIDDLLAFSRINTQPAKFRKLSVAQVIDRLLLEISADIKEVGAKVLTKNLPKEIIADESFITQLFQNLIKNGIKFQKEDATPIIEIGCVEKTNYFEFSVKDNGIGVSEENLDKIFKIFEKLHSNDRFEGTGLGLTICKKIVELHLGRIWIESKLGEGSTFFFTIGKGIEESRI